MPNPSTESRSVAVIGSICLDVTHYLDAPSTALDEGPVVNTVRTIGGKGYNQAIAVGCAGAQAVLLAGLGGDGLGQDLRIGSEASVVTVHHVADRAATDICSIMVAQSGERQIYPTWDASSAIGPGWMSEKLAKLQRNANNPYRIYDFSQVLLSFTIAPGAIIEAAEFANDHKIPLTVNAAPTTMINPDVVARAQTVIGRSDELAGLSRRRGQVWITTFGASGLTVETDTDRRDLPAYSVAQTVDSTGAGDFLAGYLTGARAASRELQRALDDAMAGAAISVTRKGAAISFPTHEELVEFQSLRA